MLNDTFLDKGIYTCIRKLASLNNGTQYNRVIFCVCACVWCVQYLYNPNIFLPIVINVNYICYLDGSEV